MIFQGGWRHQDGADEVLLRRLSGYFIVDVVKELVNFLVGPDIFTLIIGDYVKALAKCLFDAVFVVFYLCRSLSFFIFIPNEYYAC